MFLCLFWMQNVVFNWRHHYTKYFLLKSVFSWPSIDFLTWFFSSLIRIWNTVNGVMWYLCALLFTWHWRLNTTNGCVMACTASILKHTKTKKTIEYHWGSLTWHWQLNTTNGCVIAWAASVLKHIKTKKTIEYHWHKWVCAW